MKLLTLTDVWLVTNTCIFKFLLQWFLYYLPLPSIWRLLVPLCEWCPCPWVCGSIVSLRQKPLWLDYCPNARQPNMFQKHSVHLETTTSTPVSNFRIRNYRLSKNRFPQICYVQVLLRADAVVTEHLREAYKVFSTQADSLLLQFPFKATCKPT